MPRPSAPFSAAILALVLALACRTPKPEEPIAPPAQADDGAEPSPVSDPDVDEWLQSSEGALLGARADTARASKATTEDGELTLLVIPLTGAEAAEEAALIYYRDPAEGFETYVRTTALSGDAGERSGEVRLAKVSGEIVLSVSVERGEVTGSRSDLVDLDALSSTPKGTTGVGSPECFWGCIEARDPVLSTAATKYCKDCVTAPTPTTCSACAAFGGMIVGTCLAKCGFPGTGSGSGYGGGGCMGGGFDVFPSLCH